MLQKLKKSHLEDKTMSVKRKVVFDKSTGDEMPDVVLHFVLVGFDLVQGVTGHFTFADSELNRRQQGFRSRHRERRGSSRCRRRERRIRCIPKSCRQGELRRQRGWAPDWLLVLRKRRPTRRKGRTTEKTADVQVASSAGRKSFGKK